jgi:hypothetical protein
LVSTWSALSFSGLSKNCHLYGWIAFSDPTIQVEKLPFIENPDGADYSDVPCKKQIAE